MPMSKHASGLVVLVATVVSFTLSLCPRSAFADQCQVVTAAQAAAAVIHLRPGRPFIELCEPCGQHFNPMAPNVQRVAGAFDVPEASGMHHVSVNGRDIDLAYVFVRGRGGSFTNLARLSGCDASGISEQLVVTEAEVAPGVPVAPAYGNQPQFMPPPPVAVAVAAPPPVAPLPVAPPPPQGNVFRYSGQVGATAGTAPTVPGARCVIQVQQLTSSPRHNCRVEVTCGGQYLYGRGNSGYGVCGFNSVRRGLIFRSTSTTVTMQDPRTTMQDGDPSITLSLPNGSVIVQDSLSPVNAWSARIVGIRQM